MTNWRARTMGNPTGAGVRRPRNGAVPGHRARLLVHGALLAACIGLRRRPARRAGATAVLAGAEPASSSNFGFDSKPGFRFGAMPRTRRLRVQLQPRPRRRRRPRELPTSPKSRPRCSTTGRPPVGGRPGQLHLPGEPVLPFAIQRSAQPAGAGRGAAVLVLTLYTGLRLWRGAEALVDVERRRPGDQRRLRAGGVH